MSEQLKKILLFNKRIKALLKELEDVKAARNTTLAVIAESIPDDEKQSLLWHLYWETDIKVSVLQEAFDIKPMNHFVGPCYLEASCVDCNTRTEITVTSREKLRTLTSAQCICADCSEARERRDMALRQARKIECRSTRARIQGLKDMPYRDYLQSPEWQQKRKSMLRASGYRCSLCNAQGELHVHHKTYERRGQEFQKDLIVLCAECHRKFHDIVEV